MFCEKYVLRNCAKFTGKHLCQSLLVQLCEISKNTFFYRTPLVAAPADLRISKANQLFKSRGSMPSIRLSTIHAKSIRKWLKRTNKWVWVMSIFVTQSWSIATIHVTRSSTKLKKNMAEKRHVLLLFFCRCSYVLIDKAAFFVLRQKGYFVKIMTSCFITCNLF